MINYKLRVKNLVNKHGTSSPFDLSKVKIIYAPHPSNIRGFLACVLKRKYIILSDILWYQAQKLTICHEIGHAQLHKGYGYYFHADNTYYVPAKREFEANNYSIHLLSYSNDINVDLIIDVINDKHPDPHLVHTILSTFMECDANWLDRQNKNLQSNKKDVGFYYKWDLYTSKILSEGLERVVRFYPITCHRSLVLRKKYLWWLRTLIV